MLLLVTGASGVGKSTARLVARTILGPEFENTELMMLGPLPPVPTVAWRQEQTEVAVQRSVALAEEGRHLLFAGDPVALGEVLAAPSADRVDVAGLLLDADEAALDRRLDAMRNPREIRHLHHGFADWMRHHAVDPSYVPEAITNDSWEPMVWDRWLGNPVAGSRWGMEVLDTSSLNAAEVGTAVADWAERAVRGEAPVFRAGWHLP